MNDELILFPDCYRKYAWNAKHKLFGYPPDTYPEFLWISSLEKRFIWLRNNSESLDTASIYLIREMIEWGGSQKGILQKFTDNLSEINLNKKVQKIIRNLDEPEEAISLALSLPGFGLTYASKFLRFMRPDLYGALDNRIRDFLFKRELLSKIQENNNSRVTGYVKFIELVNSIKEQLHENEIRKPICNLSVSVYWRPAEIEMAIFSLVDKRKREFN